MIPAQSAREPAAGRARWRSSRAGGRVAVAAVALALAGAGCAAVPDSGAVQQTGSGAAQTGISQEQDYSQPIPVPPSPDWSPSQIVLGFLAASASFANDHAVAREYLDRAAQDKWQPGWAVTVVGNNVKAGKVIPGSRNIGVGLAGGYTKVTVTGLRVATLTDTGQSVPSAGPPKVRDEFSLIKINSTGQWRIDHLPTSQLLLTQADFQRVYQPRDLYFLGGSGQTLVPDPVFVPQQDTNTQLATGLVRALLQEPRGWLNGSVTTGFPRQTALLGQVKINGPNAIVNLGGKAATASSQQQVQMAAQLAWTLASGPTAIQSVELEINGHPKQIKKNQLQLQQAYQTWMPTQPAGTNLYFISKNGTVGALSGVGQSGPGEAGRAAAVPGVAGSSDVPALRSIAVSPDRRSIAGISAGGNVVYIGSLGRNGTLRSWRSPTGTCTSLSWDHRGDLWITAGGNLYMLAPGSDSAEQVPPFGDQVSAFRVAPDGVRAVMIVNGDNGDQVQLVAITHTGASASLGQPVTIGASITHPTALSWYDADDVIVLAAGPSGSQLEEVPLNGGNPTPIAGEDNMDSVTASSSGGGTSPDVAVGLASGEIMVSTNLGAFENTRAAGQAPVYPG